MQDRECDPNKGVEDLLITDSRPVTVEIHGDRIKVGHVVVFRNANGTWSSERVREIYEVGEDTVSFGHGPIGHAQRTALKSEKVYVTQVSANLIGH